MFTVDDFKLLPHRQFLTIEEADSFPHSPFLLIHNIDFNDPDNVEKIKQIAQIPWEERSLQETYILLMNQNKINSFAMAQGKKLLHQHIDTFVANMKNTINTLQDQLLLTSARVLNFELLKVSFHQSMTINEETVDAFTELPDQNEMTQFVMIMANILQARAVQMAEDSAKVKGSPDGMPYETKSQHLN